MVNVFKRYERECVTFVCAHNLYLFFNYCFLYFVYIFRQLENGNGKNTLAAATKTFPPSFIMSGFMKLIYHAEGVSVYSAELPTRAN